MVTCGLSMRPGSRLLLESGSPLANHIVRSSSERGNIMRNLRPFARARLGMLVAAMAVSMGLSLKAEQPKLVTFVGLPADVASSAYQYRADRKTDENPPESWFALM